MLIIDGAFIREKISAKREKNYLYVKYLGFRIPKLLQISKHFAGSFHQTKTSYF